MTRQLGYDRKSIRKLLKFYHLMQKYHNSRAKQSLVSPKLFRNHFLQYYIQSELIDKYSQITEFTQL